MGVFGGGSRGCSEGRREIGWVWLVVGVVTNPYYFKFVYLWSIK